MSDWMIALIAIGAAFVLGSIAARIARSLVGRETNPEPVQANAASVGTLVFSVILVIGLIVALGVMKADALDQITDDAVAYIPRAMSAAIVLIVGNIVATIASSGAAQALGRASASAAKTVPMIVKAGILGFTGILAASQLGIDTTTINIAVAAMFASTGLSLALLVGLGGRGVSSEIAAGRALRRILGPGDEISGANMSGTVITVHSTAVELQVDEDSILVPNTDLLATQLSITRTDHEVETA